MRLKLRADRWVRKVSDRSRRDAALTDEQELFELPDHVVGGRNSSGRGCPGAE